LKKFLISILILNFLSLPALAFELDTSIDDDIRRNYNPSKIEEDNPLPALPRILNEQKAPVTPTVKPVSVPKTQTQVQVQLQQKAQAQAQYNQIVQKPTPPDGKESYITLKKGTKVKVRLQNSISDKTKKGTKLTFVSQYPVSTTYFTIPSGTVFKGEIARSHKPQFGANGGLIVIKINSMIINSSIQPVNAYVTKANSKKIFLNNIKGKRKYMSSMFKSTRNGRHFFRKMLGVTQNLAFDGSSIVLTPFSFVAGAITLAGNVIAAPALAMFYKGGSINIPEGSNFEIKLSEDVFIYK